MLRWLTFEDLFFAPAGHCHYCQVRLPDFIPAFTPSFCFKCYDRQFGFWRSYGRHKFKKKNKRCLRCGSGKGVEIAHMLSVKEMWRRKTYPVMTKRQFAEDWCHKHGVLTPDWESQQLISAWRRQIEFNRIWVSQVLDTKNWRPLCMGCHDYFHARERLQSQLKRLSRHAKDKMLVEARLKSLDELNTPTLVRRYGYRNPTKRLRKPQRLSHRQPNHRQRFERVEIVPIPPELIEYERWDGFQWVPVAKA